MDDEDTGIIAVLGLLIVRVAVSIFIATQITRT
jgi:hypothetical protein